MRQPYRAEALQNVIKQASDKCAVSPTEWTDRQLSISISSAIEVQQQ